MCVNKNEVVDNTCYKASNHPGERIFAESQQLYKRDKDFTFAPRQFER